MDGEENPDQNNVLPPSDPVEAPVEVTNNEGGDGNEGGDAPEDQEPKSAEPVDENAAEAGEEDQAERTAENPEGGDVPAYAKVDYSKDQSKKDFILTSLQESLGC